VVVLGGLGQGSLSGSTRPSGPSSVTNAISPVSRSAGGVPAKTGPPALPSSKLRGQDEWVLFPAGKG
jgi:hypothetical protein